MSQFSAAIKLGDLDDYLSPANECIVPLVEESSVKKKSGVIRTVEKAGSEANVAAISLSDCLACSGCVTSAETVLLQSQSIDELLMKATSSPQRPIVISISSASRRKLSAYLHIHPSNICRYIGQKFMEIIPHNPIAVTDTSVAEAIAVSETRIHTTSEHPTISSHCPGWALYATKTLDGSIVEKLSPIKSAEQIQGLLLTHLVAPIVHAIRPEQAVAVLPPAAPYHVFISPCSDKKLEILRPGYHSVDLVLSTIELLDLIQRPVSPTHSTIRDIRWQSVCRTLGLCESWMVAENACETGGGYAQSLLPRGQHEWTESKNNNGRVNVDLLTSSSGLVRSHGFRNIQNISKKIKGKFFIEVMACPGGCPNGGGQPRTTQGTPNHIKESKMFDGVTLLWNQIQSWWHQAPNPLHVDYICDPHEYQTAVFVREQMLRILGADDWLRAIKTEWKQILPQSVSVKW